MSFSFLQFQLKKLKNAFVQIPVTPLGNVIVSIEEFPNAFSAII